MVINAPRLVDLYSCAGGAGMGYMRAGFDVTGFDIVDRPRYPGAFEQADALQVLRDIISGKRAAPDALHASPPCQARCSMTLGTNKRLAANYDDFYDETKELMVATGLPGVIENPAARPDMVLCGEMFGLGVLRHRKIELVNWTAERSELTEAIPPAYTEYIGTRLLAHLTNGVQS